MKKLAFLLAALPMLAFMQSADEAEKLLNKVYESTLGLETQYIKFTNTIGVPSEQGIQERSSSGELYAEGEKVRVNTDAFIFISTGEKAYLIYPEDEEIEETADGEETSLSPADILKRYRSGYSYKMAGTETKNGQTITYIRLKPVVDEEVKEIVIGVNTKDNLLHNYTQYGHNGTVNTFQVDEYKKNPEIDPELFNIDSEEFKGYYRL